MKDGCDGDFDQQNADASFLLFPSLAYKPLFSPLLLHNYVCISRLSRSLLTFSGLSRYSFATNNNKNKDFEC